MDYDDRKVETYQFLFDLPNSDKELLAKFAGFEEVIQWENWLNENLANNRPMPPYEILGKIGINDVHSLGLIDWFSFEMYIELTDKYLDNFQDKNERINNGKLNHVEIDCWLFVQLIKEYPQFF